MPLRLRALCVRIFSLFHAENTESQRIPSCPYNSFLSQSSRTNSSCAHLPCRIRPNTSAAPRALCENLFTVSRGEHRVAENSISPVQFLSFLNPADPVLLSPICHFVCGQIPLRLPALCVRILSPIFPTIAMIDSRPTKTQDDLWEKSHLEV